MGYTQARIDYTIVKVGGLYFSQNIEMCSQSVFFIPREVSTWQLQLSAKTIDSKRKKRMSLT